MTKAYSVHDIRRTHRRAYLPWEEKEDDVLLLLVYDGYDVEEICHILERGKGAIRQRVDKLGATLPMGSKSRQKDPVDRVITDSRGQHEAKSSEVPECPRCGSPLVLRKRRDRRFWACSAFRETGCELWVATQWDPEMGSYPFVPPPNLDLSRKPKAVSCPECGRTMRYRKRTSRMEGGADTPYVFYCRDCNRTLASDAKYREVDEARNPASGGGAPQSTFRRSRSARTRNDPSAEGPRRRVSGPSRAATPDEVPLAPDQKRIASLLSGVHCVIAGPGAGKTRTIVGRVVHLLKAGVDPEGILLLSHTRAAKRELKERLGPTWFGRLGGVSTFHALARRGLRQGGVDVEEVDVAAYPALVMRTKAARDHLRAFQHVIVDEFQDTNDDQLAMFAHLRREAESVMVVGDPNQAIYTWAGVSTDVFGEFRRSVPKAVPHVLGRSYRCSQAVLDLARDYMVAPYDLRPAQPGGQANHVPFTWLERTVDRIQTAAVGDDAAILTRTNDQAAEIRSALTREIEVTTIHKAKGREWDSVVLVTKDPDRDEEERKVTFVGVTRARKAITLFEQG